MPNLIPDRIREVGGVQYLHARIFERAYQMSRRQYKKRLQKGKYALEETLSRTITAKNLQSFQEHNLGRKSRDPQKAFASRAARSKVSCEAMIRCTLFEME